jgi:hypothetical protein
MTKITLHEKLNPMTKLLNMINIVNHFGFASRDYEGILILKVQVLVIYGLYMTLPCHLHILVW